MLTPVKVEKKKHKSTIMMFSCEYEVILPTIILLPYITLKLIQVKLHPYLANAQDVAVLQKAFTDK